MWEGENTINPPFKPMLIYPFLSYLCSPAISCIFLNHVVSSIPIDLPLRNITSFVYKKQPSLCVYLREAELLGYF